MTQNDRENIKILLVDDEEGIRNVLKITLSASGRDVSVAHDGESGLEQFEKIRPGIVITDIKMPGLDGIALLKKIKKMVPQTEVIMITGHGDMELAVQSLQYEAADFITKPIDIADLESAIRKAEERISISQNIQSYMDDLEDLVKEKDQKINESQRLVTIGQTIAGMSHAIKNISGGLKGSAFVLEQGIEQENREYLKKGWEMMKGNIDKITKLSLDLLNYAKTTRLMFRQENPNTPAREVVQLMKPRAELENIDLKLVPCRSKQLAIMDKEAVHTCLLSLVTNAFDAVKDVGAQKQVELTVGIENGHVTYTVEDNGCGVEMNVQKTLFNEFVTTKGMKGTGFGLMTSKKIIEEHQGSIRFESKPGEGSCFVISIPLGKSIPSGRDER